MPTAKWLALPNQFTERTTHIYARLIIPLWHHVCREFMQSELMQAAQNVSWHYKVCELFKAIRVSRCDQLRYQIHYLPNHFFCQEFWELLPPGVHENALELGADQDDRWVWFATLGGEAAGELNDDCQL